MARDPKPVTPEPAAEAASAVEPMTTQAFIQFCAREVAKRQFYAGAKAFAEQLLMREKEMERAEQARDVALAETTKARYELEMAKRTASAELARDTDRMATLLRSRQETADKALAAAHAELVQVQGRLAADAAAAGEVRAELERVRTWAAGETAAIQKRIAALQATETETRERLAAALRG